MSQVTFSLAFAATIFRICATQDGMRQPCCLVSKQQSGFRLEPPQPSAFAAFKLIL